MRSHLVTLRLFCLLLSASLGVACGDDSQAELGTTSTTTGTGGAGGNAGPAGSGGQDEAPEGCNPLLALSPDGDCLLPYPSDFFLVDDASTPTGRRIAVPPVAQLLFDGQPIDMLTLHAHDGFSPQSPILAVFPEGVDPSSLPAWNDDADVSTGDGSPTVIVDAETGDLVAHFAELDPRAHDDARRALILRPLVRLEPERRYIVGIRDLARPDGGAIESPRGFALVRDGAPPEGALATLAARYDEDVFPALESIAPRATWQLAWDFTTASADDAERDMLDVREQMLATLADGAPDFSIDEVTAGEEGSHVALRIDGTMTVPLFLEATEPGSLLQRDGDGRVAQHGTTDVPFSVWVPPSVAEREPGAPPARLLQYGHGFFGTRDEVTGSEMELADEEGFVIVATEWWGMAKEDGAEVVLSLDSRPELTLRFTDRLHQAMANQIALARLAIGPLAEAPELAVQGAPAYDASTVYFTGNSLGHILGGTYVALSPDVDRAVLGVGGANFSLMMFRARPFLVFLGILGLHVKDPLDQQKFAVFAQSDFDRIDPGTYAHYVRREQLPGGPPERHVLLQAGLDDASVTNLASMFHARAIGVPLLEPTPFDVPLLERTGYPAADGFVLFDFNLDLDLAAHASPASEDTLVHDGVRHLGAAKAQLSAFLREGGEIVETCDGVCNPE